MGDILSTFWDVQYRGGILSTVEGYHEYFRDYLECGGRYSVPWGYHNARGGYHKYREGVQYSGGKIFCYLSTPMVLNTPRYS